MSESTRSGIGSSIPGKRRKSIFRRIADSLSSFVPSVILPQTKCETTASLAQDSTSNTSGSKPCAQQMVSDSRLSDKIALPNFDQYGLDVDLDAVDNSDEEISAHTSTSGVSSLLPRTARSRMGVFPDFPVGSTTMVNSEPSCPDIATRDSWAAALTKKSDSIYRPAKKPRLSNPSLDSMVDERRSPFYLSKTTYGGAASCRSWRRRDLFEPTVPLRFELESTRPVSESAPLNGPNLSSAARHILQSLERFSSPLSVADRVPLPFSAGDPQRPVCLPKSFRSHRYPPYLQAYNHLKSLRQRPSVSDEPAVSGVTEGLPVTTVSSLTSAQTAQTPSSVVSTSSVHFTLGLTTPVPTAPTLDLYRSPIVPTISSGVLPNPPLTSITSTFSFAPPIRRPASAASQLALSTAADNNASKYDFSSPTRLTRSSTSEHAFPTPDSKIPHTTATTSMFDVILGSTATNQSKPSSAAQPPPFGSLPTWRCVTCLMENVIFREKCSGCGLSKPAKDTATDATSNTVTDNPALDQWSCRTCSRLNNASIDACAGCRTPRSDATSHNQPAAKPSQPLPVISQSNSNKWQCSTCLVCNDPDKLSCPCCQTPKPNNRPVPDDKWKCPSCSKLNDPEKKSCPCQTSTTNALPTPAICSTTQNQWECPTCLVRNALDKLACPCCSTPQPGSSGSAKLGMPKPPDSNPVLSVNTGLPFRFGLPSTTQSVPVGVTNTSAATAIATFSFGIPPSSTGQNSVPAPFLFNSPSPVTSCSAESVSLSKSVTACSDSKSSASTVSEANKGFSLPKFSFSAPWTNPVATTTAPAVLPSTLSSSTVPSVTVVPTFQFGQSPAPKLPSVNGLVNGDSPGLFSTKLNSFDPPPCSISSGERPQSSVSLFNGLPKFDFSSSNQSGASGFRFGLAPSSTVTSVALPPTHSDSSSAQPNSSTPFVFGSSTNSFGTMATGLVASPAPSNIFSPGCINQRSSSPPAGNVFSVSDSVPARRKLHAVRRFQR